MKYNSCVLCNNSKLKTLSQHVRDSKKHKVVQCSKCSHVQISPVPTLQEYRKFYDEDRQARGNNYYKNKLELKHKTREDTIRRVELIKKLIPQKSRILEIGSGYGFFLEEAKKSKYEIIGIEISNKRRKYSKNITTEKVLNIDLSEQIPDIGKFDLIVMFQVLEHIIEPVKFLKNISSLLKPHGKLIVEVPNFSDFQLKLNSAYREWYWQRAHIHYFSSKTLKHVISKSGFTSLKIMGIQRYSIENMLSWKLTGKPQLHSPTYTLQKEYDWIEKPYKNYLERKLLSDTLVAVGTKK